jgi:hypothetical protein
MKNKRFEIEEVEDDLSNKESVADVLTPSTDSPSDISSDITSITDNKPASIKEKSPEDDTHNPVAVGRLIAEQLEQHGYHPVIIFGSSNSGKSSLLGSLFSYFQIESTKSIGIFLGEAFLPSTNPYGKWALEESKSFFYKGVQEFLRGTAHVATRTQYPFFIPVRIVPLNKPEIKMAFLESNGEWYRPKPDTASYFQDLREEINSVLMHYQRGISFIHIAPYTQVDSALNQPDHEELNRQEIDYADSALVGAINAYESIRGFKKDDAHLFLMTKWDEYCKKRGESSIEEGLMHVDISELEDTIKTSYLRGFTAFNNIKIDISQKYQMNYCSGIMRGREVVRPNQENREILNRYPMTVWNWLYKNATRCNPDIGIPETLIPQPKPIKKTLYDYMTLVIDKIIG